MPTKSTTPTKAKARKFKTEAEYVDWLHSPEGREAERQHILKSRQKPVLEIDAPLTPTESVQVMKATGARLHMRGGFTQRPNDPSVIEGIIARAREKATQAISIRIPVADLEAAKRLAEKTGLGYQTILKDLIHEGLQRAS
jgi:hypothetical protein